MFYVLNEYYSGNDRQIRFDIVGIMRDVPSRCFATAEDTRQLMALLDDRLI